MKPDPSNVRSSDLFAGIMTGTSLDAIDVALVRFQTHTVDLVHFSSSPWPETLRALLLNFATAEFVKLDDLTRAHFLLATTYADAVHAALKEARLPIEAVRAIGLHGQTIRHLPLPASFAGLPATAGTYQLGSGSALAAVSGIDVVHDFRSADVALGGQGAPLVPMFDAAFLRSPQVDRLVTNIGGISNVTWLPAGGDDPTSDEDIIAFDCGPGNMMIDRICQRYCDRQYDTGGELARASRIDLTLLMSLLSHPYFQLAAPKSCGRELFGDDFLEPVVDQIEHEQLLPTDALATLTELTARSIAEAVNLIHPASSEYEIIVSGGGAYNTYLLERIKENARSATVITSNTVGIDVQAKESIAFAYFAKAFLSNETLHLPRTTGASQKTMLGSLSRGRK